MLDGYLCQWFRSSSAGFSDLFMLTVCEMPQINLEKGFLSLAQPLIVRSGQQQCRPHLTPPSAYCNLFILLLSLVLLYCPFCFHTIAGDVWHTDSANIMHIISYCNSNIILPTSNHTRIHSRPPPASTHPFSSRFGPASRYTRTSPAAAETRRQCMHSVACISVTICPYLLHWRSISFSVISHSIFFTLLGGSLSLSLSLSLFFPLCFFLLLLLLLLFVACILLTRILPLRISQCENSIHPSIECRRFAVVHCSPIRNERKYHHTNERSVHIISWFTGEICSTRVQRFTNAKWGRSPVLEWPLGKHRRKLQSRHLWNEVEMPPAYKRSTYKIHIIHT